MKDSGSVSFWARAAGVMIPLALVSLAAGAVAESGAAAGFAVFAAGLLGWLVFHLRNLNQLRRWMRDPDSAMPDAGGTWEEVMVLLYRRMRAQTQIERELAATLERFQSAGGAMPDGVVIIDGDNRIEWCNAMAVAHFGLDLRHDRGQQITYLLRQPSFMRFLREGQRREPLVLHPVHHPELTLSLMLVPFDTAHKLLISTDITQLERVERVRRDFVANVSHELRTPLTVVGGFLETLSDMDHLDPEPTRHALRLMGEQTRRMQRLVEDLLTLSRLETEQNRVPDEAVDVPRLMESLLREAESLSAGRHRIDGRVESPCGLRGSEEELRSAMANLVSNAVRYTPDGGSVLLAWRVDNGEGVFSVRDTGIGIEAHHISRLTERFYRVDRSRSRETGGTGLGLAIVKHVLTRHQGRLEISSEPGRGSEFAMRFPASRVTALAEKPGGAKLAAAGS